MVCIRWDGIIAYSGASREEVGGKTEGKQDLWQTEECDFEGGTNTSGGLEIKDRA